MYQRSIIQNIVQLAGSTRGRLVVLSGARQVGKTTLVRSLGNDWSYLDMDDPIGREIYGSMSADEWTSKYRKLIVDEVQKLPQLFETFKACHDRNPDFRAILLGSSQVLLLRGVRESLAGRAAMRELFPLTLEEICAHRTQNPRSERLDSLLAHPNPDELLTSWCDPTRSLSTEFVIANQAWQEILTQGGMPAPTAAEDWSDQDKREWHEDYVRTYLQKDLADVARLEHLEPFVRMLRLACLRTAQTANWNDLAKEAGVSAPTARTWMGHLEVGYHAVSLPPWFRNQEKRLARSPKLHILDAGVRRAVLRKTGVADGAEYETAVFAEIWKRLRMGRWPLDAHHLRTLDGRKVDILLERHDGYFALECKSSNQVTAHDARHLMGLEAFLDKPLLAGIVVSDAPHLRKLKTDFPIWAAPAAFLLG